MNQTYSYTTQSKYSPYSQTCAYIFTIERNPLVLSKSKCEIKFRIGTKPLKINNTNIFANTREINTSLHVIQQHCLCKDKQGINEHRLKNQMTREIFMT